MGRPPGPGDTPAADPLARRLAALVAASPHLMGWLHAARAQGLADWCIGAGAVRNLVWDALHGHARPTAPADVDLVYFAPDVAPGTHERAVEAALRRLRPDVPWEVCNQAFVHLWYPERVGQAVPPLASLADAVASWPEYATAVGVWLDADDRPRVIAPHGLDDLFAGIVRHNPARASVAAYRQRLAAKRLAERWPRITVVPA